MIKIKSKNQNYVLNTIFFFFFNCETKTMYQNEFLLQSWIQIRIKVPTSILKKIMKPKQKTKTYTKQAPKGSADTAK